MGGIFSHKFDPLRDVPNLKGKVIVVTGGNRGIGYATVKHLARRGAKVYLAARDESKATGAIASLEHEGLGPGNGEVIWLKLDLSDPRLAKRAAEDFLAREKRLDVLVNNAGMLACPYEQTSDGLSHVVVVNYISPFTFTRTLIPLLTETAQQDGSDVRIVNVGSTVHQFTPANVRFQTADDFNVRYDKRIMSAFIRYCHSKFTNIPWTRELQRRFDANGIPITVMALHPGGVDTFTHKWPFPRISAWLVHLVIARPDEGAYTSVFAAASSQVHAEPQRYRGKYMQPVGKLSEPSKLARNPELAVELWQTTERFLESIGL